MPSQSGAKSFSQLFKEITKAEALCHWTRPGVEHLSEVLYWQDPMGLRGFGVPPDEYEPEAELAFAYAFGLTEREQLWQLPFPRALPSLAEGQHEILLSRSFEHLFEEAVELGAEASEAFKDALAMCATEKRPALEEGAESPA